jgi:hypothetical protein
MKFKCRPADECYWDDPYYTKEVEVKYDWPGKDGELRSAAEEFAAKWCNDRSEYGEMDVQVLTADGWVTFEVNVVSVPEFVAERKKGAAVVPDTFRCNQCDKRFPKAEREFDFLDECHECYQKSLEEEEEDE